MSNKEKATKISWLTLAFMAFSTVWGFGNITNGFVYFNGPQVIFSWIFMFALYFIPYALMVGELGSAFKNEGGGVSSWLHQTTNAKLAYYAGWTYWACHITYIASKGSGFLKALSWAVFRNAETYDSFPHPLHPAGYLLHPAAGLLHCKLGSEPSEKAADCRRHLHLRHVPAVHRDDVRCPGHQPHGRVRPRQPELQQHDPQL